MWAFCPKSGHVFAIFKEGQGSPSPSPHSCTPDIFKDMIKVMFVTHCVLAFVWFVKNLKFGLIFFRH